MAANGCSAVGRAALLYNVADDQQFWLGFRVALSGHDTADSKSALAAAGEQTIKKAISPAKASSRPPTFTLPTPTKPNRSTRLQRKSVRPIFRYESNKAEQAVQRFLSSWEKLQRHGGDANLEQRQTRIARRSALDGRRRCRGRRRYSRPARFSRNELDAVQSALRESAPRDIFTTIGRQYFQNEVSVFDRSKTEPSDRQSRCPRATGPRFRRARNKLRTRLGSDQEPFAEKRSMHFTRPARSLIEPSVSYDSVATENGRGSR